LLLILWICFSEVNEWISVVVDFVDMF